MRLKNPLHTVIQVTLWFLVLILLGCSEQRDSKSVDSLESKNAAEPDADQKDVGSSNPVIEESQKSFDGVGLSLQEIFEMERAYDIDLLISPTDGDYYVGEIIRRDSEWLAFYSGEFFILDINEIQYGNDNATFLVDKWAQFPLEDGTYRTTDVSRYSISVKRSDLINAVNEVEAGEASDAFVRAEATPIKSNDVPDLELGEESVDIAELSLRELFQIKWFYDIELSIYRVDYDSFFGKLILRDSRWMINSDNEVAFLDLVDIRYEEDRAKFLFDRWIERPLEDGTIRTTEKEKHRFFVDRSAVIEAMNEVKAGNSDKVVIPVDAVSNDSLTFDQEDALIQGDIEQVERFLDEGTQVDARDAEGITALMYASYHGQESIVNLLIERGANINASEYVDGRTALMDSSINGQSEMVELLLNRGADINAKSSTGWTALMWAVERKHNEVVDLLVDRGAYLDSRNDDGKTAVTVALESYNFDAITLLQEAGAGE